MEQNLTPRQHDSFGASGGRAALSVERSASRSGFRPGLYERQRRNLFGCRSAASAVAVFLVVVAATFAQATSPPAAAFTYDVVAVSLPDASIVQAQVADTPEKARVGLMFRKSLDANQAMLFPFETADFHSFWMKNCEIPLDIVWLNDHKQIVHLGRNLPPCRSGDCPTYTPSQKARYVIELQAGTIDRRKLALGQSLLFTLPK